MFLIREDGLPYTPQHRHEDFPTFPGKDCMYRHSSSGHTVDPHD